MICLGFFFLSWLLNVPVMCKRISWTDLLRQIHLLLHSGTSCRSNNLTQSKYTDTGQTSPGVDPITPGAEYHEALASSANDEVRCDCTFADDGNVS